ncbi:class I SAM-dependent methyltransferase [Bacillus velezensis]|uniref:class I SAM-dependent methyltransferase n=1 Tax=Bacillus velezensis TaxID=492670 RepID=UPI002DBC30DC|nr:class I SAM-dependent methyltransferase [Bacillus velezensis]MEC1566773.1 class I SAM-dependent methyltransferase [Bacillus velezensis]
MTTRYGIDAPYGAFGFIFIALLYAAATLCGMIPPYWGWLTGTLFLLLGLWMLLYSTAIKLLHRHRILSLSGLKPDMKVLDVGTGRGLLAIAAAQKGADVSAIDKWSSWDLVGNGRDAFEKNRQAERAPEIDLYDGLAQDMPFPDETFDFVISHFTVHNISGRKKRERAIAEMVRVLKPGGTLAVSDIKNTSQYRAILEENGFQTRTYSFYYTFPFSKLIIAVRTPVGTGRSIC